MSATNKQSSYSSKGGISEETETCSPLASHHLWQQQDSWTLQLPSLVTEVACDVVISGAAWDCPDLQTLHSKVLYRMLLTTSCLWKVGYLLPVCTGLPCSSNQSVMEQFHGIVRDVQHRTLNTMPCRLQSFLVILLTTTQFPTTKNHNAVKH